MGKRMTWALAFVAALAACTSDTTEATSTTDLVTTTSSTTLAVADPGRLVAIASSGNVVVMDPDGSNQEEITDDAGDGAFYAQPVWSPDTSSIAWGQATGTGFAVGIHSLESGDTTTVPTGNLPFYMYWSPDGRNLGVLHNGTTGVAFQMVDVAQGTNANLDEDTPFYFSWSPDSDRVATHAGVSRAETLSPDGDRVELEPTAGTYLAPQWTEAGVFHVVDDQLVLESEDGNRTPVAAVSGLTMFVANHQGTRVALQSTGDGGGGLTASTEEFPTVVTDAVVVVDTETGEAETVDNAPALGFFWSPDGQSLLVLTPEQGGVVPSVWSVGGDQTGFDAYQPPGTMLQDTFPFFPQYAQSVSFWAPDSTAFAFAGVIEGEIGVWVQDLADDSPTMVSDGVWVAWSPAGG